MKSRGTLSSADEDLLKRLNRIVERSRRQLDLPPLEKNLKEFVREASPARHQRLAEAFESDHSDPSARPQ